MLDSVVDQRGADDLRFRRKAVEQLLLVGAERVGLNDDVRGDGAAAVDNASGIRLELRA